MTRPKKAVVEYFPHFVNHGKTIYTLETKFGDQGYVFWFKLLELLGATEHHYLNCNDIENWEFLLAKTHLNEETANNILNLLAKLDSIDQELWEYKIIRSANFITNLESVYQRRKISVYTKQDIINLCVHKLPVNGVSVDINPQSKVEYSRVKYLSEEREIFLKILEIFYFKNYKNPEKVANTFFNHYSKIGWKDKNGNSIENPIAAAGNWENKTTVGKNCPADLLSRWKEVYEFCKESIPEHHLLLFIRPGQINDNILKICGNQEDIKKIEDNDNIRNEFKKALVNVFGKIKVEYQIDS